MMILSTATQDPGPAPDRLEEMIADDRYKTVLKTLADYKSMPFLELAAVCDIDDETLQKIVKDLESEDVVKVSNPENVFEEIVTLKDKGFAIA